jgi:hypothetical protein
MGLGPGRKKEVGLDLFASYGLGEFLQGKEGGYNLELRLGLGVWARPQVNGQEDEKAPYPVGEEKADIPSFHMTLKLNPRAQNFSKREGFHVFIIS